MKKKKIIRREMTATSIGKSVARLLFLAIIRLLKCFSISERERIVCVYVLLKRKMSYIRLALFQRCTMILLNIFRMVAEY